MGLCYRMALSLGSVFSGAHTTYIDAALLEQADLPSSGRGAPGFLPGQPRRTSRELALEDRSTPTTISLSSQARTAERRDSDQRQTDRSEPTKRPQEHRAKDAAREGCRPPERSQARPARAGNPPSR